MTRGVVPDWLDVSRETLAALEAMLALVEKWNPTINLVAAGSLVDAWQRHILDSAQLFRSVPANARTAADLGSGAGFPGLVLAIVAREKLPGLQMTLIESDKRKAAFLMQASRQLGLQTSVVTDRAESLPPQARDVVSARALAPLTVLCGLASRHLVPGGVAIFPKGALADQEMAEARKIWRFEADIRRSETDPQGRILALKNIQHA